MDSFEIRVELTDLMIQDMLWSALAPDALIITRALNKAIAQQIDLLGVSQDDYTISGISVADEGGQMVAELTYTRRS